MIGYIHSMESMGLVDGPGIRCVVFLQGCALRCRYCHNPDTWVLPDSPGCTCQQVTPQELFKRISRFRSYFSRSGGGVTFSGGEPLMQPEFLAEILALCKQEGIHTCIDTAGVGLGQYDEILQNTDLVLYDVKHYTPEGYRAITGREIDETQQFLEAVRRANVPLWVRHVVVPGLTDSESHLQGLSDYLHTLPNVQRVELLPYHTLGVHKYETLHLPYSLADTPSMDKAACANLQQRFFPDFQVKSAFT